MRIYYRGPDALVTQDRFVWRSTPARAFVIRQLRTVVLVRRPADNRRPVALAAAFVIACLAAGSFVAAGPVVAGTLAFLAVIAAAAAVATRTPHSWEVRAVYQGAEVTVYASADVRVFNQVTRALRRAVEDDRPVRSDLAVAA